MSNILINNCPICNSKLIYQYGHYECKNNHEIFSIKYDSKEENIIFYCINLEINSVIYHLHSQSKSLDFEDEECLKTGIYNMTLEKDIITFDFFIPYDSKNIINNSYKFLNKWLKLNVFT